MSDEEPFDRDENEFGPFGTGVKPVRFPSLAKYSHLITFLMLLAFVPLILTVWYYVYWHYLEQEPPFIEVTKLPAGLGSSGNEIAFRIRDRGTGLEGYEVRLVQKQKSVVLLQREYPDAREEESFTLVVNAKSRGFLEGEASVVVTARDRAFRKNSSSLPVVLKVDFQAPGIEYIAGDMEFSAGDTGFVCYRVSETSDILSGVTFRTFLFPGLPAKGIHADFAPYPNVFCAFFPIPIDAGPSLTSIRIFVRDPSGNTSGAELPVKVRDLPAPQRFELVPTRSGLDALEKKLRKPFGEDLYRVTDDELMPLFSRPKPQAFWTAAFRRPSGEPRFRLGDLLSIHGESVFNIRSQESSYSLAIGTIIRASADGTIIYADDLEVFGKTLIIDHGFGIASVYSHLSGTMKREGDRVAGGDEVAVAGESGITPGEGYGFAVRVHGIPVRDTEWNDPFSYTRFFPDKLRELRKKLGIREVRILE